MVNYIVHVHNTKLSQRRAGHSRQPSILLVLFPSYGFQQVVLMLRQNGAKPVLNFVHLENGEPDFVASVGLRVEKADGSIPLCSTVVHGNFDNVFETALDVGHDRKVPAMVRYRLTTGRGTHETHCARVPGVEATGVEVA